MDVVRESVKEILTERAKNEVGGDSAILVAKGVTMVVLCSVSILMGLLPLGLAMCFNWSSSGKFANPRSLKLVGLLLGFGGGVLFCTTFLHMLPEVTENVESLVGDGQLPELSFALPETFVCLGFFIMYLVEESVHSRLRKRQASANNNVKKDVNRSTSELVENGDSTLPVSHGHSHSYGHGHSHLPSPMMDDRDDFVISSLRGLLIVLGLSVHELFEGLAIGLESSTSYVWYMFGAVAAHKFVIAFCIGVELIASRTNRFLTVVYVCTFAVVSPMGIGIGMALTGSDTTAASGPLAVILQGVATGTLLYVVFFEILQHHRDGLHQYLSILVGFLVMFGLQIATAHSHSHSHGHSHGHGHSHHDNSHGGEDEHEKSGAHSHDEEHHNFDLSTSAAPLNKAIEKLAESVVETVTNVIASSTTASPKPYTRNTSDASTLRT
ncbi:zinc transporter ZIP1-like isoform X2 [Venturia canescens]|uniref:zinc transporter ZIP1-like isoform X2 n=1 Tax=Venturia canescens TaxID=32260 RepID=UPI001C9D5FB9|nr:zinc transporter ZIP1-like isoform X2 [Venturia canescens]XP_043272676.1 zinc transporter ZIP1-like isoform X2 [Venturia canescens]XP_043272677.1 zinc transporter ZIP1-like isoform X2 [Venturia canescens]